MSCVISGTLWGVDAREVQVEVDCGLGLPGYTLVGLPDSAVRESRERVVSAMRNCGFSLPNRRIVVSLAPADLRKEGALFDLAIALALLDAAGTVDLPFLEGTLVCGELALDGRVRPIRGALALALLAKRLGCSRMLLPRGNAAEVALAALPELWPVDSLGEAIDLLNGFAKPPRLDAIQSEIKPLENEELTRDFSELRGQRSWKRVLEISAAGGHPFLVSGPPGSGKTLGASCLPGILPPLTEEELLEVTRIHSVAGLLPDTGIAASRPFRAPHHTVSRAGLVGGGTVPKPGEASLAHHGVLFLDELPEFYRPVLETLRQPLELGEVRLVRAGNSLRFPARFLLGAAMNPCPCGFLGDHRRECRCNEGAIRRYQSRLSGPLLDRIDLLVEAPALTLDELESETPGETTAEVRKRVVRARDRQHQRAQQMGLSYNGWVNARLSGRLLREAASLDSESKTLMRRASERWGLSARSWERLLRVALTIADLQEAPRVLAIHISEALQYRSLSFAKPLMK